MKLKTCSYLSKLKEWISGTVSKEPKERREFSSQVKRRRMLQFDSQISDSSLYSNELSSTFLKSTVSSTQLCYTDLIFHHTFDFEHCTLMNCYI